MLDFWAHRLACVRPGEALALCVDFLLTDVLYNISREREDKSTIVISTSNNMRDIPKFCLEVLWPDAHGHLFYSALQFSPLYKVLSNEVEEQEYSSQKRAGGNGVGRGKIGL